MPATGKMKHGIFSLAEHTRRNDYVEYYCNHKDQRPSTIGVLSTNDRGLGLGTS